MARLITRHLTSSDRRTSIRIGGLVQSKFQHLITFSSHASRFLFLGIALAIAGIIALAKPPSHISADSVVVLHPNSLQVNTVVGQVATVNVVVENIQDFYGAQVYLHFDPAVVQVVDANLTQPGIQVTSGSFLHPDFVQENQADNALGTIDYVITQLNPTLPVSGSGTLFSVQFRAMTIGQQTLITQRAFPPTVLAVVVGPQVTAPTPYQWQDGTITVAPFVPYIYYFPVIGRSH